MDEYLTIPNIALLCIGVGVGIWFNSRPVAGLPALHPTEFREFKLREKTKVSHNAAIYRFDLPSANQTLGLPIGQHISVGALLPAPEGAGEPKDVVRSYTPVSGDSQGYFDLLIKTYPDGKISQHVASLQVGQKLRVRGPKGQFNYAPNMVKRIGMMAGGSGITPMLQILQAIEKGRKNGDRTKVDLIYANVAEEDILLKKELDEMAAKDPEITVHYVLEKPPSGWEGGVGYISPKMIKDWLPASTDDAKILLCGPPPMVSALKKATEAAGFQKARPVSKMEDQVFAF